MANIAVTTVFQMHDTDGNGVLSREDFTRYGERVRKALVDRGSNQVDAYFSYSGMCFLADVYGMTKDAKDGGKTLDPAEFEKVRSEIAVKGDLILANKVFHTALFRALDISGDGFIDKNEWANYLKVRQTYANQSQADVSFDSIDKNKDGKLSMEEFVDFSVDFWCNLGKMLKTFMEQLDFNRASQASNGDILTQIFVHK